MAEMWRRIRRRLSPGGTPSLPELYPGEKDVVDSVEIAHDAEATTSLVETSHDDFLDTGRITLRDDDAEETDADEAPASGDETR